MLGGSPTGLAESSSHSLRTGHSSQVALHLVSRQRSYHFRLQAGNGSLVRTFTRQFKRLHRRTSLGRKSQEIGNTDEEPQRDDMNADTGNDIGQLDVEILTEKPHAVALRLFICVSHFLGLASQATTCRRFATLAHIHFSKCRLISDIFAGLLATELIP